MTRKFSRLQPAIDRRYAELLDDAYPDIVDHLQKEIVDGATVEELAVFLRETYGADEYFAKRVLATARHLGAK